jgi:hypothetical protein
MAARLNGDRYTIELAREAVAELAPRELPLFAAAAEAFDSRAAPTRESDTTLGFGVAEAAGFLSPILLHAASKAVEYVLSQVASASSSAAQSVLRRMWTRFMRALGVTRKTNATIPPLTVEQLGRAREVMLDALKAYRGAETDRVRMADVLVGRLALMSQRPASG